MAANIAKKKLLEDATLVQCTVLSVNQLLICLASAYRNHFYRKTFGTVISSPFSVTVANFVMQDLEVRAIATYHSPPVFWK